MSETRHHIRSVSDLYAADEIEVLLEEIRDLESPPAIYSRPEDIQDFEIAGSRTGERTSSQLELDSPGVHSTVHSWDSHANYHGHYDNSDKQGSGSNVLPWSRASHIVIYCDIQGHLKTSTGVVRLLLLVSSAACLATLCSSGTAKVSLFMLPFVGRLRFMIFVAVFCLLITALLLFLDISHVIYILPLNWAKLNAWVFTGIGLSYVLSSTLVAYAIWEYHVGSWVPKRTRSQLSAAAVLGFSCALLAFVLSFIHGRNRSSCKGGQDSRSHTPTQLYKPVDNSSSSGVTLKERSPKRPTGWAVKNQQSKKRNADSDTNTSNGGHRGSNHDNKFKQGARKDHWASARQHILETQTNNGEDTQREELEIERRRRRRRKEGDSSSTGDGNPLGSSKIEVAGRVTEEPKTRRVPRKLPLQSVEQLHTWSSNAQHRNSGGTTQIRSKTMQTPVSNDAQNCGVNEGRSVQVTRNGLHWETERTSSSGIEEAPDTNAVRNAMWSGQWHPPPDDVQPCSSKTIDPYSFA